MLNPIINQLQGYDNMMPGSGRPSYYDPELNVALPHSEELSSSNPLVINRPSSLLSAVSHTELPYTDNNQVKHVAVLTILDEIPPDSSFRPPFIGMDKTVNHTLSDVNFNLLSSITPSGTVNEIPLMEETLPKFEKLWPDQFPGHQKERFLPLGNMPNYGREVAGLVSQAALMLTLDYPAESKQLLAIRMIQIGIDLNGIVNSENGNTTYSANGGHCSGRMFPIVFAGYMLEDQNILNTMNKTGLYAYQNGYHEGNLPDDYIHFGETDQTFIVTVRDVERMDEDGIDDNWDPDDRVPYQIAAYTQEDVENGLVDWGVQHVSKPSRDNAHWISAYRSVNSVAWSGFILASRIMGIEDYYNHQPLFDYVDKWMQIESEGAYGEFQQSMWDTYRYNTNY
jgi:hypothetical protein